MTSCQGPFNYLLEGNNRLMLITFLNEVNGFTHPLIRVSGGCGGSSCREALPGKAYRRSDRSNRYHRVEVDWTMDMGKHLIELAGQLKYQGWFYPGFIDG